MNLELVFGKHFRPVEPTQPLPVCLEQGRVVHRGGHSVFSPCTQAMVLKLYPLSNARVDDTMPKLA